MAFTRVSIEVREKCDYLFEKSTAASSNSVCFVAFANNRSAVFNDATSDEQRLRTCFLQKPVYPSDSNPDDKIGPYERDLSKLADISFLFRKRKNTNTFRIFSRLNDKVLYDLHYNTGLGLFIHKEPRLNDVYRLDFAFRRAAGQAVCPFVYLSIFDE